MELRKIIISPDSFKGSLSAREVADCCAKAVRKVFENAEIIIMPIADGGEGTIKTLSESFGGVSRQCRVSDPLGRDVMTSYMISEENKSAIMEVAQASGITLLSQEERNPLKTSTYGLGMLIADAIENGCRNIMVGLGGSATNDGGMGMLSALGYKFLDKDGQTLKGSGEDLNKVVSIDSSHVNPLLKNVNFTIACDVDNLLIGENGATAVYGPQKGATPNMLEVLENGMQNYARIMEQFTGNKISNLPGAGAAGGLGAAFLAFFQAKMIPGIELVLDTLKFDNNIKGADLIITGEGKIDSQSLRGKVLSGVLRRAKKEHVPVLAIAGSVEDSQELNDAGLCTVMPIQSGIISLEEAMKPSVASSNIVRTVSQLMLLIKTIGNN